MRIAVLADTHDLLPEDLRPLLPSADEVWHLGDVCSRRLLDDLRALNPRLSAVRGNCDPAFVGPETLTLDRGGLRFFLIHIPVVAPPPGVDCVLHGHTHVPRDETIDGVRFLNPGNVAKPNHGAGPSFAWLTLAGRRRMTWEHVPLPSPR